jgi:hypothetical protein
MQHAEFKVDFYIEQSQFKYSNLKHLHSLFNPNILLLLFYSVHNIGLYYLYLSAINDSSIQIVSCFHCISSFSHCYKTKTLQLPIIKPSLHSVQHKICNVYFAMHTPALSAWESECLVAEFLSRKVLKVLSKDKHFQRESITKGYYTFDPLSL